MQLTSITGEPAVPAELENPAIAPSLPITPGDLNKLARRVPNKEMELLIEICDRARRNMAVTRTALLLCAASGSRIARMLDQDPLPAVTQKVADRLRQLRERDGL